MFCSIDAQPLRLAGLQSRPLHRAAELQQGREQARDAGVQLRDGIRLATAEPLTLDLRLPEGWLDGQSLLTLRLACQPLNAAGYLYYRIPLDIAMRSKPITAAQHSPAPSNTRLSCTPITFLSAR